jgi:dephospho-CoA kinase
MKIVGLTGSIGMGKTTTAAMFTYLGVPVWDADSAVHGLYAKDGAGVGPVSAAFPSTLSKYDTIDRDILGKLVLGALDQLKLLESIVHPLVSQDRAAFLAAARAAGAKIAIVDVPLLFETGGEKYVDSVIVVSCAPELQRQRVLARGGMTEAKFESILARQTPDEEKRARADFVITTDLSLDDTREQAGKVYAQLLATTMEPDQCAK